VSAAPPTAEDVDYIARVLVTHLWHTVGQALIEHDPGSLDAVDFSRFLHGELRQKVTAIEQRIASLLPPVPVADVEVAEGERGGRAYLRRCARDGDYVRTTAGLRRVTE
jgi:hypothetical protein